MSVLGQPHYEIPAIELALWLERQGAGSWWTVDGDPSLMENISFPCSGDDLARALRDKGEPLLVIDARHPDSGVRGQQISADRIDEFAELDPSSNRVLELCWKRDGELEDGWLLIEDKSIPKLVESAEAGEAETEMNPAGTRKSA